jgi:peptide-methionine (R)-S-oxide reductase
MTKFKYFLVFLTLIITVNAMGIFDFFRKSEDSDTQKAIGSHLQKVKPNKVEWKEKPDQYWKDVMTPLQYDVTRHEGTERAFSGRYWDEKREGVYHCSACGHELFKSETKFKSGTGWPSFYDVVTKENIKIKTDKRFGMTRTEASCARCGSHLGHVFEDGPKPTGLRYCINSVSLIHSEDIKIKEN